MKKNLSSILSLSLLIQPLHAAQLPAQSAPSIIQQMIDRVKSLKQPTAETYQAFMEKLKPIQDFVASKWQCMRYGTNCSKEERAKLVALSAAVTAAAAAGALQTGKFVRSKLKERAQRQEQLNRVRLAEEGYKRLLSEETEPFVRGAILARTSLARDIQEKKTPTSFTILFNMGTAIWGGTDLDSLKREFSKSGNYSGHTWISPVVISPHLDATEKQEAVEFLTKKIGITPTAADLLQMRFFDWQERADIPAFLAFSEYVAHPSQELQQVSGEIGKHLKIAKPILPMSVSMKKALNERAELRERMNELAFLAAQMGNKAAWFDKNVDSNVIDAALKNKLINIITLIYWNSPKSQISYSQAIKEFPDLKNLRIKGSRRNYDLWDVIWGSPETTELQKADAADLLGERTSNEESLWHLHTWEDPIGGFKLPQ